MHKQSGAVGMVHWVFGFLFMVLGRLNTFLAHPVAGILYWKRSSFHLPPVTTWRTGKIKAFGSILEKVAIGIVVIWRMLAIGDLAEISGL